MSCFVIWVNYPVLVSYFSRGSGPPLQFLVLVLVYCFESVLKYNYVILWKFLGMESEWDAVPNLAGNTEWFFSSTALTFSSAELPLELE